MPADTVERVAEDHDRTDDAIVEGFDPELIARTKKVFGVFVPNGERKITAQMFHALRTPFRISSNDQLRVGKGGTNDFPRKSKFRQQVSAVVEPGVRRNPVPALETTGLAFGKRLARRMQHRMAQANRGSHPGLAGIRTPVGEKIYERLQQRPLNRCTVPMKNADNSAQAVTLILRKLHFCWLLEPVVRLRGALRAFPTYPLRLSLSRRED